MKKKTSNLTAPDLTPNALTVLERRYMKRDPDGKVLESPVDLFSRVADTIAEADRLFHEQAIRLSCPNNSTG